MYLYVRAVDFWRTAATYQDPQEVIPEAKSASEVFMRPRVPLSGTGTPRRNVLGRIGAPGEIS